MGLDTGDAVDAAGAPPALGECERFVRLASNEADTLGDMAGAHVVDVLLSRQCGAVGVSRSPSAAYSALIARASNVSNEKSGVGATTTCSQGEKTRPDRVYSCEAG